LRESDDYAQKVLFHVEFFLKLQLTFRRYPTVANPANCVLSAKIIFLREERSTIQEKPAIADNGC
jgi:hypothetical protein